MVNFWNVPSLELFGTEIISSAVTCDKTALVAEAAYTEWGLKHLWYVQITHDLNGTQVCAACAQAENMCGIKPCMYMHIK